MRRLIGIAAVAWPFLKAVLSRYFQHEGSVVAGYMAFAAMLAVFPFLLFATALTGAVMGAYEAEAAVAVVFASVPDTVAMTIEPVLMDIVGQRRGGLITLSAIGALYAASNGAEAVRVALDRAYEADIPRNMFQHYAFSLLMVMIGFLIFIVLAAFIVSAPIFYRILQVETEIDLAPLVGPIRFGTAFAVFSAFLWVVHRILPARRMRGFRLLPGVLTTVAIWVTAASGFSYYLSNVGSYTVTYGTLAGVIVTLVFFYIAGVAIIFGGEVNAVVNANRLVTVVADQSVLDALDEEMEERDAETRPAPDESLGGDGNEPQTEARLDQARSPAERAEMRARRRAVTETED